MKGVIVFFITGVCLMALQACSGNKSQSAGTDSITSTDSLKALNDTAVKSDTIVDKSDIKFLKDAASGGITEVILGKLALKRGINKRVKNFGAMMTRDHNKANNSLMALAKSKHISLMTVPDDDDQKIIDMLSKKSGEDFDKAYVSDMVNDHQNDIKEFDNASKNCSDPEIKQFAAKMLPVLKNHLDAINIIHGSMK